jgi:hypothetical protein
MLYELTAEQVEWLQDAAAHRQGFQGPTYANGAASYDLIGEQASEALDEPVVEPTPLMVIKASAWLGGDTGWAYDILCDVLADA